jgi:hypothetical protein
MRFNHNVTPNEGSGSHIIVLQTYVPDYLMRNLVGLLLSKFGWVCLDRVFCLARSVLPSVLRHHKHIQHIPSNSNKLPILR